MVNDTVYFYVSTLRNQFTFFSSPINYFQHIPEHVIFLPDIIFGDYSLLFTLGVIFTISHFIMGDLPVSFVFVVYV